jgi:hypothetical protein
MKAVAAIPTGQGGGRGTGRKWVVRGAERNLFGDAARLVSTLGAWMTFTACLRRWLRIHAGW